MILAECLVPTRQRTHFAFIRTVTVRGLRPDAAVLVAKDAASWLRDASHALAAKDATTVTVVRSYSKRLARI
jgi:hypothetical protein